MVDLWEKIVSSTISKLGDESMSKINKAYFSNILEILFFILTEWVVYEQVYIAALDCNNLQIANVSDYAQYPFSYS